MRRDICKSRAGVPAECISSVSSHEPNLARLGQEWVMERGYHNCLCDLSQGLAEGNVLINLG
jgi:hypothetical protein